MLTLEFVKEIYKNALDPRIEWARAMNNHLRLHVDGIGLQEWLSRINNYENEKQFEARRKHAISNKFVVEDLLRPVDNAFNAKGGSRNYKFTTNEEKNTEEFVNILSNVKSGQSLSEYIKTDWFHLFVTDPNGLIFLEINEDSEDSKAKLCYKSIHSIKAYEQNGQHVNWVIFEPHEVIEKDKKETKYFWAVDKEFYYLYSLSDNELVLIEKKPNDFEKVPAILCSNISDTTTGWKKSPIDGQLELLDRLVISTSVLNITEFQHNYPREWTYVDTCNTCNGTGKVYDDNNNEGQCSICDGTGKSDRKDVTDIIKLRVPSKDGIKIDPPGGFTSLPTDALQLQYTSKKSIRKEIEYSQWGTTYEKDVKNETATGRFLDVQPVNNRLDKYSGSIEKTETLLADLIGKYHFPETFEKAHIQRGRRYLVETPDQVWEKYIKAKNDKAPVTQLNLLLYQYIESEYRENPQLMIYEFKKVKLEPFVHWSMEEVERMSSVSQEDKVKKAYFNEWCLTKTKKDIIDKDLKSLENDLNTYIKQNVKKDEQVNKTKVQ